MVKKKEFPDWPEGTLPPKPPKPKTEKQLLEALVEQGKESVAHLRVIKEKINNMANNELITEALSRIEGNTANVERVLTTANTQITALLEEVQALKDQIAAGSPVTAEQAQAILDRLNAADAAMDTLTGDAAPTE